MNKFANKNIVRIKPYSPPIEGRRQYQGMLLDFNERTIPPSPKVVKALNEFLDEGNLQVYPEYSDLESKIADYADVDREEVMIVNGSDQGIDLIFRTFTSAGGKVIIPSPSFAMFYQCAGVTDNEVVKPEYKPDFSNTSTAFPLEETLASIDDDTELIIICNPNNPTGTLISIEDIEVITKKAKNSIVYIDEAYFEFSGITATSLIKKYPNLIITRTFSKAFGLASLRIGYVLAQESLLNEMKKVRGPYDINMMSVCAAKASLKDLKSVRKYVSEVMGKAKLKIEKFFTQNRIEFYPSGANFILFKPNNPEVFETLRDNGLLLRPRNGQFIRLTIGTTGQMEQFIQFYRENFLQKYAFLDRDGALIFEPQDDFQIDSIEKLQILPGVIKGLKCLQKKGFKFIMISNQDGVGTKSFPKEDFEKPQQKFLEILKQEGIEFEEIFICPHKSEDNCNCRKPKTGLVDAFFKENLAQIDMENSFMYGDRKSDQQFAENLNLKFIKTQTNGKFDLQN